MMATRPLVSVLIPVYNGETVVGELHRALGPVLDEIEGGAEIVYVDDGSADRSLEVLKSLQRSDRRVRVVELVTNFGQHAAFSAAFAHARGQYFVTMDADLQCDPRDIPRLLAPLADGSDLVSGVRVGRRDPWLRRVLSRFVTRLVAGMAGVKLRDIGCPFNACTAELGQQVAAFGELRRFLKPLVVRLAKKVTEVEVVHRPRPVQQPRSSYSATALLRLFMDFFVGSLGDVFAWVFVVSTGVATVLTAAAATAAIGLALGRLSISAVISSSALAIGAWLVALLGLVGDYVQRVHRQSSGRPFYLVRRVYESDATGSSGTIATESGTTPALVRAGARASGGLASGG
jgi:hypothetical protein